MSGAGVPGTTSVPNVRTRGPCVGDTPWLPVLAMNQVLFAIAAEWSGAGEVAGDVFPRPPPNCPTITIDVGILFAPARNERLLVRLIVRGCPEGTVITTGDQVFGVVNTDAGFNAAHGGRGRATRGAAEISPHRHCRAISHGHAGRRHTQIDRLLAEGRNRREGKNT